MDPGKTVVDEMLDNDEVLEEDELIESEGTLGKPWVEKVVEKVGSLGKILVDDVVEIVGPLCKPVVDDVVVDDEMVANEISLVKPGGDELVEKKGLFGKDVPADDDGDEVSAEDEELLDNDGPLGSTVPVGDAAADVEVLNVKPVRERDVEERVDEVKLAEGKGIGMLVEGSSRENASDELVNTVEPCGMEVSAIHEADKLKLDDGAGDCVDDCVDKVAEEVEPLGIALPEGSIVIEVVNREDPPDATLPVGDEVDEEAGGKEDNKESLGTGLSAVREDGKVDGVVVVAVVACGDSELRVDSEVLRNDAKDKLEREEAEDESLVEELVAGRTVMTMEEINDSKPKVDWVVVVE